LFFQLLKSHMSYYIFFIGYTCVLFLSLINKLGFFRSLWTGFSGGIAFLIIWCCILRILMILLSEKELLTIFKISGTKSYQLEDENDDDLTAEELYSNPSSTPIIPEASSQISEVLYPNNDSIDEIPIPKKKLDLNEMKIAKDGKFDLSVNGKTLRVTPQDGAQATRKVIYDDKKTSEKQ